MEFERVCEERELKVEVLQFILREGFQIYTVSRWWYRVRTETQDWRGRENYGRVSLLVNEQRNDN